MDNRHALTLHQIDTIRLSLDKSLAVARMVAECGTSARPAPDDEPPVASLFVVMQVIVDELEKIEEVLDSFGDDTSAQSTSSPTG